MEQNFDRDKQLNYWIESSDDDFETMQVLFLNRKYSWSLFLGHLMIEKLLKGLFVKINNEHPPFTHNLLRLADKCNLALTDDQKMFLVSVTAFNINGRYDDYKMSFQKTCTLEFTGNWVHELKKIGYGSRN
jgi:HEPN domain-containing protein